jgi:hypothetical protein
MVVRFAKEKGLPVIAWYKRPTIRTLISEDALQHLYQNDNKLTVYVVKGAPCCISQNINVNLLLANGTPAELHSPLTADIDKTSIDAADFGEIAFLTDTPIAVNVRLNSEAHQKIASKWPAKAKIPNEDGIIIPLKESTTTLIQVENSKNLTFNAFPFELRFALTFHKAQGQTVNQVIIN